jgi:hypothetical protein
MSKAIDDCARGARRHPTSPQVDLPLNLLLFARRVPRGARA